MAKRYVIVSAETKSSNDLVKKVNELLDKGYELYGSPQVSISTEYAEHGDTDVPTIYQAMTKQS